MFSVLVVTGKTHFNNLEFHDIAHPKKEKKYSVMYFLLSRSPIILTSIQPFKIRSNPSKYKQSLTTSQVPKYPLDYFPIFYLVFSRNLLKIPIS